MVLAWGSFFTAIERTSAGVAIVLFHIHAVSARQAGLLLYRDQQ
jgi:hypothetical protein